MRGIRSAVAAMVATGTFAMGTTAAVASVDGVLHTPDGRDRTYHVYVPASVEPGTPVPLLVALHGATGWGTQFERNSGFDRIADRDGFIVVYPDGVGLGSSGAAARTWNGGGCCGPAARQDVDDVGFIRMLVGQLRSQYAIDPARIYAVGHSNGGIFAYRLACELSDVFAGIGVQSSSLEVDHCAPSSPVSVIHIHGTADRSVPIDGGRGPNGRSGVSFHRPIDGARKLAVANGCAARATTSTDRSNHDVTLTRWRSCDGRTEVRFLAVKGASHAWMGHPTAAARVVGTPYTKLDSSEVIWRFLRAHPRR